MIDHDELLWMFKQVHGDVDADKTACFTEVREVEDYEENTTTVRVHLMKNGNSCWSESVEEILFNYTMKNIKNNRDVSFLGEE